MTTAILFVWAICAVIVGLVAYYGTKDTPRTTTMVIGCIAMAVLGPVIPLTILAWMLCDATGSPRD